MSSMWGVPFSCCSFLPCWVEACGEVYSGLLVGGYLPFLWSSGEAVIRPTPISWGAVFRGIAYLVRCVL
nr:hypothetical protein Q903MT_gene2495 [Picea sitchensis]